MIKKYNLPIQPINWYNYDDCIKFNRIKYNMNRNEVEDELNKLISMMMLDKPFKQTVYMW